MMTKKMILEILNDCDDMIVENNLDGNIYVTIDDWAGFDENWNEIFNDVNEEQIDLILNTLESKCVRKTDDLYVHYYFNDYMVCVGWSSFDI